MKIIVIGAGKVGYTVAEQLSKEGHDITVVDRSTARINSVSNSLDVISIEGSGSSSELLIEAGVKSADMLIATTGFDELNMVCGISAKKLGVKAAVARIRDPEYLRQTEFLREALGLSMAVNPDLEAAAEIARILQFPIAARVERFSRGSVDLIEYRVPEGSMLDGLSLKLLGNVSSAKILVCAVVRGSSVCIPNGDYTLKSGDMISIAAPMSELRSFFIAVGAYKKPVRNVIIMGGSRIAAYLSQRLMDSGIRVSLIESKPERCDELKALLPKANIICGDGTKSQVLLEEGLNNADAFVALTGYDEDNIIVSMYASSCGVGKVVAKINEDHYADMLKNSGLDCIISPKMLVAQQITSYVRAMQNSLGSPVESLYRIIDGQVEALEFKVTGSSRCIDKPLKDLKLKNGMLIASIIRKGRYIFPNGNSLLGEGDRAIIITTAKGLNDLDDILED